MGTLGIIAEMTLKVRPLPETSALCWIRFRRLAEAAQAVERLNTSGTRPVALELLNAPGARRIGGLPVEQWVLVVGFEDNAASVAWQVDRLMLELGRTDLVVRQGEDSGPLWSALVDAQAAADGPVTFSANMKPSAVPGFLQGVDADRWEIQAHAGNGIVRGHALGDPDPDLDTLGPEVDRLRAEAVGLGGNLILPRCPAPWKDRLRVWGHPRPEWAMAQRVKAALDPAGALNPGRFVGTI
jgi:glycolate oxidase FAD binding subunit